MDPILIRGTNDVASAVAHRLFRAGYAVALVENAQPAATRRGMAFADAVYDGRAEVAGVEAVRVDDPACLPSLLADRRRIPLLVGEVGPTLATTPFAVLVDARMRKRAIPEPQRGLAPLTIGLGPNFVAGGNVDVAIETSWEDLGRVITEGPTLPLAGEPRPLGGSGRERYVYAPHAGTFRTARRIGEPVVAGETVGHIDATPLPAPLTGVLRGLTHDGAAVVAGTKVIEVDPRGRGGVVAGIGERPARIAEGVLRAVTGGTW
jgi:xanthine dehydrogenase accessory factor